MMPADSSALSVRQAHRLLQLGLALFFVSLLVGLAVPRFVVPRLGLSVHLLGILQGLFLAVVGLLWHRLTLGPVSSRVAFWAVSYGCIAAWSANLLGAVWGAGSSMLPMAAGGATGSQMQEQFITVLLRTGALGLIVALLLLLWGLRGTGGSAKP
jgi:(hydroxyamino)benzene mutase